MYIIIKRCIKATHIFSVIYNYCSKLSSKKEKRLTGEKARSNRRLFIDKPIFHLSVEGVQWSPKNKARIFLVWYFYKVNPEKR